MQTSDQQWVDGKRLEESSIDALPQRQMSPVRPPSPPVPPPNEPDETLETFPSKVAKQKQVSREALSTILNSVASKQGQRSEGEPRYSFSSASSTDEMLPPPPLPCEPPPQPQQTIPEKQLMTSTLFDRFSTKKLPSTAGRNKSTERDHSPKFAEKPSPTSSYPIPGPRSQPSAPLPPSTSTYGLPSPYDFYHTPVSKQYSPEVPSHPLSPGPHDSLNKPALSTIFHGQMTPSSTASDSPPTYKTKAKGEMRSIEISSPVFVSSSNQTIRQEYGNHYAVSQQQEQVPNRISQQQQPLSASGLDRVVYQYNLPSPSAPPAPASSPPSSQNSPGGGQSHPNERYQQQQNLLRQTSETVRRSIEDILRHEMEEDMPSSGRSNDQTRSGQQSGTTRGAGGKPLSAAAAVAEILANRQPLSVRISIQKHKTETSYKKSQSFGSDNQGGSNAGAKNQGGGGGARKSEYPFSESSL